eukprot:scpid47953/ scgid22111/ Arachidonate 5-lipoxygenase
MAGGSSWSYRSQFIWSLCLCMSAQVWQLHAASSGDGIRCAEDFATDTAADAIPVLEDDLAQLEDAGTCAGDTCPARKCPPPRNADGIRQVFDEGMKRVRQEVCRIDTEKSASYGGIPLMWRGPLESTSTKISEIASFLLFKEWTQAFQATMQATNTTQYAWLAKARLGSITKISQLDDLYNFFMNNYTIHSPPQSSTGASQQLPEGFWQRDNSTDPFLSINQRWNDDEVFAQARLMATNPLQIQRVTLGDSGVGMSLDRLKPLMSKTFQWNRHFKRTVGVSFRKAIHQHRLYVLDFPLLAQITADPNATSAFRGQKMLAPIAFFVATDNQSSPFRAVAIQLGRNSSAPVYTPASGYFWWTIAKMYVNSADGLVSQIAHHLVNAHLVSEAFAAATCRELPLSHPVHSLLSPHFQGLIGINTQGFKLLTSPTGAVTKIAGFGYEGMGELINLTYKHWTWNHTDFKHDLMKRGVLGHECASKVSKHCQKLLYYPYRDDGMLMYETMESYVTDYVNNYYCTDKDVITDGAIQAWAKYIAAVHKDKGFPARIGSKALLSDVLLRIIWVNTVHHAILNFPVKEFGSYVPAISYTLRKSPSDWANEAEAIRHASPQNNSILLEIFPEITVAVTQTATASQLASLRLHGLFEHTASFGDDSAVQLTNQYREKLVGEAPSSVQSRMAKRNEDRKRLGVLAYRYMQPKYMPNSIVI